MNRSWFRSLLLRMRSFFRSRAIEQDLDDEFRYHLERQSQEHLARGMTPEQAQRAAKVAFGGLEQRKEECRDVRRLHLLDSLIRDLRHATRVLTKNPGFTCGAILILGLGIGANTAIFTMVNSILLRQLPFKNAERLVWIWSTRTDRDKAFYSIPNFIDTREQSQAIDDIAAFANWGVNLTGSGDAERLSGVRISGNAFELLGVAPEIGRTLSPLDAKPDAGRVIMMSHGLWQRRFGADPQILDQSVLLNAIPYTVVGVLPPSFVLPNAEIDVVSPLILESDSQRSDRGSNFLRTFARLKPGVAPEQAQAELAAVTERLRRQYPIDNGKHTAPRVLTLRDEVVGSYRALLW